jgi:hypothetical protein
VGDGVREWRREGEKKRGEVREREREEGERVRMRERVGVREER